MTFYAAYALLYLFIMAVLGTVYDAAGLSQGLFVGMTSVGLVRANIATATENINL